MNPKFVTVSETVEIERPTVEGLIDTIKGVFSSNSKPLRIVYVKNEPLTVDKRIRKELASSSSLMSAYQMIRQHSDIEILEDFEDPLRKCAEASNLLASSGFSLSHIVCSNKFTLYSWFDKKLRPDKVFNVPLIEDSDCQEDCFFFCGSTSGKSVKDIEFAVLCRM